MEILPKPGWFPGHRAPRASLLLFPPLPPALPPPPWSRHLRERLCEQQEGEGAGASEEKEPGRAAYRLLSQHPSLEEQGTHCLREHLLLAVRWHLQQVLGVWRGQNGMRNATGNPDQSCDANNWVCSWPKCSSKRQITREENQQKKNPGSRISWLCNPCTGAANLPSDGFLAKTLRFFFFGCEYFSYCEAVWLANVSPVVWQELASSALNSEHVKERAMSVARILRLPRKRILWGERLKWDHGREAGQMVSDCCHCHLKQRGWSVY